MEKILRQILQTKVLLPLLPLLVVLLYYCGGVSAGCTDDDERLKNAIASHPETAPYEAFVTGCADLKSQDALIRQVLKMGACEMEQAKDYCPETCGLPCPSTKEATSLLPCEGEPKGIAHLDLDASNCSGTNSSDSCETLVCMSGFTAHGHVKCNNGVWIVEKAKCKKDDWCTKKVSPRPIYYPRFERRTKNVLKRQFSICHRRMWPLPKLVECNKVERESCAEKCAGTKAKGFSLNEKDCWCNWAQSNFCEPQFVSSNSRTYDYKYHANFTNITQAPSFKLSYLQEELDAYPFENTLTSLASVDFPNENLKGKCEGDCNSDKDCAGRLRCFHRTSRHNRPIPGCDDILAPNSTFDGGEFNNEGRGSHSTLPVKLVKSRYQHEHYVYPYTDANKDYCYDPYDTPQYTCQDAALDDAANTVEGTLHPGQTCELDEPVIVPACTHLNLTGDASSLTLGKAIISGKRKTNHFMINGKLTLRNLILEKGLAQYRGGSLHVQGFFALAHLIDTTIRDCKAADLIDHTEECKRGSRRPPFFDGGGAVFLSSGSHLHERNITDRVGLILEGTTRILNNVGTNGGGILSFGLRVEVGDRSGSRSVSNVYVSQNRAEPDLTSDDSSGFGGGIYILNAGGLFVLGGSSLVLHGNTAGIHGGGIAAQVRDTYAARTDSRIDMRGIVVTGNSSLHVRDNLAMGVGGGVNIMLWHQRKYCFSGISSFPVLLVNGTKSVVNISHNLAFAAGGLYFGTHLNRLLPNDYSACPLNLDAAQQRYRAVVKNGGTLHVDANTIDVVINLIMKAYGSDVAEMIINEDRDSDFGLKASDSEKGYGAGTVMMQTTLLVQGPGSSVRFASNKCGSECTMGGGLTTLGSIVCAVSGGTIEFSLNEASSETGKGGGALLFGSSPSALWARGDASRFTFRGNSAETVGGGLVTDGPNEIAVTGGARLMFEVNSAGHSGGALFIESSTSFLSDKESSILFLGNSAGQNGGGLASIGGAIVHLHGKNRFENNTAAGGAGGAIAAPKHGIDQGGGTCVLINIATELRHPNPDGDDRNNERNELNLVLRPTTSDLSWRSVKADWKSSSTSRVFVDNWKVCVPCGLTHNIVMHPDFADDARAWKVPPRFSVTLMRPSLPGENLTIIHRAEPEGNFLDDQIEFAVSCVESGFDIYGAHFHQNKAHHGGALASYGRKNVFFRVGGSTFTANTATKGGGGAVFLSGLQTGARFRDDCVFKGNSAAVSGGAILVEDTASIHVRDALATNNAAVVSGGFISLSFASNSIFENVTIKGSRAVHGSGGAFSLYASRVALHHVAVTNSSAELAGGAMLLDQGSQAHLLGLILEANHADEKGGQVHVSSSALVVHNASTSLAWPLLVPLSDPTTQSVVLGASVYRVFMDNEEDTVGDTAEWRQIQNRAVCEDAAFLLLGNGKIAGAIEGSLNSSCFVEKTTESRIDAQAAGKAKNTTLNTTTTFFQLTALRVVFGKNGPCTTRRRCIFRRHRLGKERGTQIRHSKAKEGGAISCRSSQWHLNASPYVADTADSQCTKNRVIRTIHSPRASDSEKSQHYFGCFSAGVRLGAGTRILHGTASESHGGGISATLCDLEIENTDFLGNSALGGNGGAVFLTMNSSFKVSRGTNFMSNHAGQSGGGIACSGCKSLVLRGGTQMSNNRAGTGTSNNRAKTTGMNHGGAIHIATENHLTKGSFRSTNSTFENNTASFGGAIAIETRAHSRCESSAWATTHDRFISNSAEYGGALYVEGAAMINHSDVNEFANISCKEGNVADRGTCAFFEPLATSATDIGRWGCVERVASLSVKRARNKFATGAVYVELLDASLLSYRASAETGEFTDIELIQKDFFGERINHTHLLQSEKDVQMTWALNKNRAAYLKETRTGFGKNGTIKLTLQSSEEDAGPFMVEFYGELALSTRSRTLRRKQTSHNMMTVEISLCLEGNVRKKVSSGNVTKIICGACPNPRRERRRKQANVCVCRGKTEDEEGFYDKCSRNRTAEAAIHRENDVECCQPCPDGANCAFDGLHLSQIPAKSGHWRSSTLHEQTFFDCSLGTFRTLEMERREILAKARCCPQNQTNCSTQSLSNGSTYDANGMRILDRQCGNGYYGPLCASCKPTFTMDADGYCQLLPQGKAGKDYVFFVSTFAAVFALLFVGVSIATALTNKLPVEDEEKARAIDYIGDTLSILVSYVQILSSITQTYSSTEWGPGFSSYTNFWSFVNLDAMSVLPHLLTGAQYNLDFQDKLYFHFATPVLIVLSVKCATRAAILFTRSEGGRCYVCSAQAQRQGTTGGLATGGTNVSRTRSRVDRFIDFKETSTPRDIKVGLGDKITFTLLLLIYPSLTLRGWTAFRCISLRVGGPGEDPSYFLEQHFATECFGQEHQPLVIVAICGLLAYGLGIPLYLALHLVSARQHILHGTNSRMRSLIRYRLGSFFLSYEPRFYFWEIVQMAVKMLLVGVCGVIAPQSPLQVFVAFLICFAYLLILLNVAPYEYAFHDVLSFVSFLSLALTFLLGLLRAISDSSPQSDEDDQVLPKDISSILIAINVMPFVPCLVAVVHKYLRKGQGRSLFAVRSQEQTKTTKIVPEIIPGESHLSTDLSSHESDVEALIKHHEACEQDHTRRQASRMEQAHRKTIARVKARAKLRTSRKMKNVAIFRDLGEDALSSIVEQMSLETFQPGETIVTQGAQADAFYIIMQGRCDVVQKNITNIMRGEVVARLVEYDHFGESALVSAVKRLSAAAEQEAHPSIRPMRNASVIARGDVPVQVMTLSEQGLRQLVHSGSVDIDALKLATATNHVQRERTTVARHVWNQSQMFSRLQASRMAQQQQQSNARSLFS